jgi:hypothetical protein
MTKSASNFVNKLKKLDNYFILREEADFLVIGTLLNIREHIEITTTFSMYVTNEDRKLWIFFIVELDEKGKNIKEFKKTGLPTLKIPSNISEGTIEKIKNYLDEFVNTKK